MPKLGIFVGEDNWTFFNEIYADLTAHYETQVFERITVNTPLLYGRLNRWMFSQNIRKLLKSNDVCLFEWASDLLAVASQMPKKCRVITRLHSFELYEWAPKINWNNVDRIIVLSEAIRTMFIELYPEHTHKLIVIHNGCSLTRFRFSPEKEFDFTLGMLSWIAPVKRIYEVVLMLSVLVKKGYPAKLRIGGSPTDDSRYVVAVHRLVERLGLQEHVIFDGFVADTPAWLRKVDIFISNSYWEGQQTSLIEALASGCFCLAHCWNGVEEMLLPENIYLTENELMEKIILYSQLPDIEKHTIRMQMRSRAKENFDLDSTKEKIIQLIEEECTLITSKYA